MFTLAALLCYHVFCVIRLVHFSRGALFNIGLETHALNKKDTEMQLCCAFNFTVYFQTNKENVCNQWLLSVGCSNAMQIPIPLSITPTRFFHMQIPFTAIISK